MQVEPEMTEDEFQRQVSLSLMDLFPDDPEWNREVIETYKEMREDAHDRPTARHRL